MALGSCIENDIPYPRIQPNFKAFEVVGQIQKSSIDTLKRTITVHLPETVNLKDVKVENYAISPEDAVIVSPSFDESLDLSAPLSVTLKLYQEYVWTVTAVQSIERYFTVEGQIGASVIDVAAHRVLVTVPDTYDLTSLHVTSMKLGVEGATQTPNLADQRVDLSKPLKVEVTNFGETTVWEIFVQTTKSNVSTVSADAWTRVAWVKGAAQAGKDNGVEYRKASDSEWTKVPVEWIEHNDGDFTARIIHLDPETEYFARAYSDNEYGTEIKFTTGTEAQVPNSNLENWWLDGKIWCPWVEGGTPYWGTGNKGATTLGDSNSVPTDDTPSGKGQAAMLQTKFVGIASLGKLAAGNLFTGDYVRTVGTNGILSFGRDFNQRPTRLTAYVKYKTAPISNATTGYMDWKGRPDTCTVWIALSDSPEKYEIRTNPSDRQLFDPNDPTVIAYGLFQSGSDIPEYTKIEVDLDYRSTSRIPRFIVIVASASKYGDFFTGGDGSVLYVDDFNLEYDY